MHAIFYFLGVNVADIDDARNVNNDYFPINLGLVEFLLFAVGVFDAFVSKRRRLVDVILVVVMDDCKNCSIRHSTISENDACAKEPFNVFVRCNSFCLTGVLYSL